MFKFFKKKQAVVKKTIEKYPQQLWEDYIGKKFIVISNEITHPPIVATFMGKELLHNSNSFPGYRYSYPWFRDENGNEFCSGGITIPYDEKIWNFILSLDQSTLEAWKIFSDMFMVKGMMNDKGYNVIY